MIDMNTTYSTKLTNQELLRALADRAEKVAKAQKISDFIMTVAKDIWNGDSNSDGATITVEIGKTGALCTVNKVQSKKF